MKKSDGHHYNYDNLHMVEVNRAYLHDAIEVIRMFPASYAIGLIVANRLFFSPTSMNQYFTEGNRAAALPMERIFAPLLYGVAAKPHFMQQPHFGFTRRYATEVNTSVFLIAQWCVLLTYGYVQARRGVIAGDGNPRALVLGFIVLTALYLYVVSTTIELNENYRYRFNIEPLFLVLLVTAATSLVRRIRAFA